MLPDPAPDWGRAWFCPKPRPLPEGFVAATAEKLKPLLLPCCAGVPKLNVAEPPVLPTPRVKLKPGLPAGLLLALLAAAVKLNCVLLLLGGLLAAAPAEKLKRLPLPPPAMGWVWDCESCPDTILLPELSRDDFIWDCPSCNCDCPGCSCDCPSCNCD